MQNNDFFVDRHIGPRDHDIAVMLKELGFSSLDKLIDSVVPPSIRIKSTLKLAEAKAESESLQYLRKLAQKNKVWRTFIGTGYYGCITPPVIQRNILENPGWYTQYTPYQAEIAQGRLEALLNFQTMVSDLTALPIANASLLDEATAAAEAMAMCFNAKAKDVATKKTFFVSELCHPQTIAVLQTRAEPLGIEVLVGNHNEVNLTQADRHIFGALVQYPTTDGALLNYEEFIKNVHQSNGLVVFATDLLALTLLKPPGELGADIAVGSSQRFGIPMGYGGPHAAFLSTREDFKRLMPGRIVGLSKDVDGKPATRLALQTREQHIRREKATSNICTAQVLLAVMAGMYAVYHGPEGLKKIAKGVHKKALVLKEGIKKLEFKLGSEFVFDTLRINLGAVKLQKLLEFTHQKQINLRILNNESACISLDETTTKQDIKDLLECFSKLASKPTLDVDVLERSISSSYIPEPLNRKTSFLTHPVFNQYHSETECLRYIHRLQSRDLSLTTSMIALGSCTMKLNATSEMYPVSFPEFANLHPFVPKEQAQGYQELFEQLETWLCEITGFAAISLQPNAGSQGEYAGLLAIRKFHEVNGEPHRNICLIPKSAHGTNPASASMAGMKVVVVDCDENGNIDIEDLKNKASQYAQALSSAMITYPSTHGVFEEAIQEICNIVHEYGGQVYMDGANMNAQVGLCRPAEFGADVCHLNLHKTFCIPHGGGGPGMGPIGVKAHLKEFLPSHPAFENKNSSSMGTISAAPWGSSSILPISWAYIAMMGEAGLRKATEIAILNANYVAKRLEKHFPVLYKGKNGLVAHECIIDVRKIKDRTGIDVEDIAKRLMDYGFHSPTMSFPVAGTLMIEPTESESKQELDRFCDAMISIRREIEEIESSQADKADNVLKNAPHTAEQVTRNEWKHSYPREKAAYPAPWTKEHKFWPYVGRINNVLGDRQLICTCPSIEAYSS